MKIRQSALFNTELNAVHLAFAEKAQSKNLENLAIITKFTPKASYALRSIR